MLLTYGANGKVASVKDSNGLPFTFTYDLNNQGPRVIKVADLLGRSVEYTWECGAGNSLHACGANEVQERLKTVKDLRGQITTYQYTYYPPAQDLSARTFLTAVIDPRRNPVLQLTHGAQAYGNWGVASVANGEGNTWRLAYCAEDSNGACGSTDQAVRFKTTVTPPLGPVRLSYFDTSGRPSGSTDGRNNTSKAQSTDTATLGATTYNRAALPVQHQSPLAVAGSYANAAYTHDERGLLTTLKDAANNPHQTGWAAADAARNLFCPASRTTPEGLTSTSTRDEFCRVKAQAQPGHAATSMAYAKVGMPNRPTTVAGPRQDNTQLDYDPPGNLNKVVGPMAETTSATYDRQGRAITQTNALGGMTRTEYEGITSLATKVTDPLNRITVNTYDASGNLATRTAANGQLTTYVYDKANRLVETRSTAAVPGGSQTISNKTVYDALGRVQQTINANSHASTSTFDDAGNVLARANPLSQATRYQYDADNRVTQVTDPAGRITSTSYDKLGRISSASTPAGSQSYDYDNDGRVTRHVDARSNATRYRYHPSTGHLIEVTDARNQITSAEYDEAGNVVAITDPKRNTTRFEFDRSNRRTKRTDPNGHVWTWDYDKAGNVTKATAPGGLVTEYVFDTASQLKQTRLPDGQVIAHTYDANGNRLTMTDATGSTSYAYDGINRLTQITDPRGKVLKYSYDAAGNRTAITYPHGNQVAYGFDAAERLTSVTDWLGKTHRYTLNAAGQVTQLALGNGTQATMVYDAASDKYTPIEWDAAFALIAQHLNEHVAIEDEPYSTYLKVS